MATTCAAMGCKKDSMIQIACRRCDMEGSWCSRSCCRKDWASHRLVCGKYGKRFPPPFRASSFSIPTLVRKLTGYKSLSDISMLTFLELYSRLGEVCTPRQRRETSFYLSHQAQQKGAGTQRQTRPTTQPPSPNHSSASTSNASSSTSSTESSETATTRPTSASSSSSEPFSTMPEFGWCDVIQTWLRKVSIPVSSTQRSSLAVMMAFCTFPGCGPLLEKIVYGDAATEEADVRLKPCTIGEKKRLQEYLQQTLGLDMLVNPSRRKLLPRQSNEKGDQGDQGAETPYPNDKVLQNRMLCTFVTELLCRFVSIPAWSRLARKRILDLFVEVEDAQPCLINAALVLLRFRSGKDTIKDSLLGHKRVLRTLSNPSVFWTDPAFVLGLLLEMRADTQSTHPRFRDQLDVLTSCGEEDVPNTPFLQLRPEQRQNIISLAQELSNRLDSLVPEVV